MVTLYNLQAHSLYIQYLLFYLKIRVNSESCFSYYFVRRSKIIEGFAVGAGSSPSPVFKHEGQRGQMTSCECDRSEKLGLCSAV